MKIKNTTMDFNECIEVLLVLNSKRYTEISRDILDEINYESNNLKFTLIEDEIDRFAYSQKNIIDKYCLIVFSTFVRIKEILEATKEDISLQHMSLIKISMSNLTFMSIRNNLIENLPGQVPSELIANTVLEKYDRLCHSTNKLIELLKAEQFCSVVLNSCLTPLITALYQIIYAPIKRPSSELEPKCEELTMTDDLYRKLTNDRAYFQDIVHILLLPKIKSQYVTAIMLLMKCKTPVWFQRAVFLNLTSIMKDTEGIETIAVALLENSADYDPDDTSKLWRILNILVKLFLGFQTSADFTTNICQQLLNLLNVKESHGNFIKPFELIVAKCIKELYLVDHNTAVDILLKQLFSKFFLSILDNTPNCEAIDRVIGDVTATVTQSTRILHNCFIDNHLDSADLPVSLLSPIVMSLLKLYASTVKCMPIVNGQLKDLLLKYITSVEMGHKLFEAVLFDVVFPINDIHRLRKNIDIDIDDKKTIKVTSIASAEYVNEELEKDLIYVLESSTELLMDLFQYLFNCLLNKDKSTRNLKVYRLVTQLTHNKNVLQHLNSNPECLIPQFQTFLASAIDDKMHRKRDNNTTDELQPLFTVIMIVQLLAQSNLRGCAKLLFYLGEISRDTNIAEVTLLINDVLNKLYKGRREDQDVEALSHQSQEKAKDGQVMIATDVDKAITDVCDPLLPVRAHGLIELTKLVEARHPDVLKRTHYVFNVFQQNLKNDDSFIYLNAIEGLAAMGELCPDSILPVIADEYSDYSIQRAFEDEIELRLKLGEVLLRVTKTLGVHAFKHKALLLNTFLKTTKDDDDLIRASSLSNMAEVCRVLGTKMGPIITEVFSCVQHVIETDASPEPRRAAISVIRQMLVGTDKLMLEILRNHMPLIYRTLQSAYKKDADEVVRLQAQLALEQLDVNMRSILSPSDSESDEGAGKKK